jgi:hypothetical protein
MFRAKRFPFAIQVHEGPGLTHPYSGLPDSSFWKRSIAGAASDEIDPVGPPPFGIAPGDFITTAGSCFAQQIARSLQAAGLRYFVTEPGPQTPGATNENYGVYSARYGNIYTARQLLQLFQRAYGVFSPSDDVWLQGERVIDPFRPRIQTRGFCDPEALRADRRAHLAAVRRCLEDCRVFIFTLGLTEAWVSTMDGAVYPLPSGVEGESDRPDPCRFVNFSVAEVIADLIAFVDSLRLVNPTVKIILTVSPVPIVATFMEQHVLVASTYSKSVLRVAADEVARARDNVAYFPGYELIASTPNRASLFSENMRSVTPEGVARVVALFMKHFVHTRPVIHTAPARSDSDVRAWAAVATPPPPSFARTVLADALNLAEIVCDEEGLDVP